MDKLKKKIPRNLLIFLLIFCTIAMSFSSLFISFSTRTTLMDFVRIDLGQNQLGEVYEGNISCTAEFDEKARSMLTVIRAILPKPLRPV